ncbi:MAG: dihydrofolate reductase family protein [Pseudomonadales bacterium]|jgi:riboflavin-specific deaminase-like protein|nr:dihydrofolate reductase family protein [Pseudomonadales bacterium]
MTLNARIETWLAASHASCRFASRPFVTLCYAQGWDGSIAVQPGSTLALSNAQSCRLTHQLRSLHDGILVGIGTVLADDPQLTVRHWTGASPQAIVLDSRARLPRAARLCQHERPCWVLTTVAGAAREGAEFLQVAADHEGHVALPAALERLYQRGIRHLMVEGGANVITAFLRAALADALVLTIAPMLVGGYKAVGELGCHGRAQLPRIAPLQSERLGDDMIVWGRLHYSEKAGEDTA